MERLNDIYLELLSWMEYEGKPSRRIWHPLFYVYPWGLRFELGAYNLDDTAQYLQSAKDRGRRIWQAAFAPEDEVLVIFNTTPDQKLKQELKNCQLQRIRAERTCPIPGEDANDEEPTWFYRHLYRAAAKDIPFDVILKRIVEEETTAGGSWRYVCAVYFYNRTKKLLFHPYDDRGADLIGPDRETLRPYYRELHDMLLDWNRDDMDRKWKVRPIYLRILTTNTDPKTSKRVQEALKQKFLGTELKFSELMPYWKEEGWGELQVTMETAQSMLGIQKRLAGKWESDTATENIRLPDVGFLWVHE